jgi:hypothetical protein
MDADQGGHIHACCDEHELYWSDAPYWTEHEDCEPDDQGLSPEIVEFWVKGGISRERFEGRPDCECHQRRQVLLKEKHEQADQRDERT